MAKGGTAAGRVERLVRLLSVAAVGEAKPGVACDRTRRGTWERGSMSPPNEGESWAPATAGFGEKRSESSAEGEVSPRGGEVSSADAMGTPCPVSL